VFINMFANVLDDSCFVFACLFGGLCQCDCALNSNVSSRCFENAAVLLQILLVEVSEIYMEIENIALGS